eukprot:TRINITY_DN9477_c0_g1_i14.p1 TRINITY_DN9477_c0_g1~~TRINITY_DN9477_c0_g1_i14.p1  ORF type:complete len:569 (-),score=145.07 TRINITY_DN9477_c0_g1_i14:83-1789(-)
MDQSPQGTSPGNIQKIKRSDLICKMGANCTNPTCPYKHPMPQQAICIYFMRGHCRAGNSCKFFHTPNAFSPSPDPAEIALKNSAMKNLVAKKAERVEMGGSQGKAQEADSGESAVAKPSPEGAAAPRKFILKRKTTPEAKANSNLSTSSVEKSKKVTPSANIKGSKELPIVIDSDIPAADPVIVEKSVSSFNKEVTKPVQPATEQKKAPVKRPVSEITEAHTSKRGKVEKDEVIENVIEASVNKANKEPKESKEPTVIIISEEKKTKETEANSKEQVITEEKARPEVKEEVKHKDSEKPEVKEQPSDNGEAKMQDIGKEIAKDKSEQAKDVEENTNKEMPMQDIATESVIKEHKDQSNIRNVNVMDEKSNKVKENEEKKVPAESKEEVKKAEGVKEAPVTKDKAQEEKMEDTEKPKTPTEPIQSTVQPSVMDACNEEKNTQSEVRKEQAPEVKPSTEEKQAPVEVHKEPPIKPTEPKPTPKAAEQEEVKAAPPKRKIKLMELVNEFEQILNNNPMDEELAKKYKISTETDPMLDVSCAQRVESPYRGDDQSIGRVVRRGDQKMRELIH